MFHLSKQPAKIAHLNVRHEIHGEEEVLAVDVTVKADLPNDFLDLLSPGLKAALYTTAAQADLDAGHLSAVRFPQLPKIEWALDLINAEFLIAGIEGVEGGKIKFEGEVKVNKLELTPKDGGTVSAKFRVQLLPDPNDMSVLSCCLSESVKVSVKAAPQPDEPPVE